MASYCSLLYAGVFLPAVVLCYAVTPQRHRGKVLLAASYLFFCSDKKTGVYYYADTYEEHQQNEIKAGLRAAS